MSAFLGHAGFRGTEYYLRLTTDLYPEIVKRMEKSYGTVIPVFQDTAYSNDPGGEQDDDS